MSVDIAKRNKCDRDYYELLCEKLINEEIDELELQDYFQLKKRFNSQLSIFSMKSFGCSHF